MMINIQSIQRCLMMKYILIQNKEEILPYLPTINQAKILAVDTETTGLDPHTAKLRLIQTAVETLQNFTQVRSCELVYMRGR